MRQRGANLGKRLVFPNLIQGMKLTGPNQVWATDITYIKLLKEFVYLSAIIDVYTREIVGWAISRELSHEFCLKSLEIALNTHPPPHRELFTTVTEVFNTLVKSMCKLLRNQDLKYQCLELQLQKIMHLLNPFLKH